VISALILPYLPEHSRNGIIFRGKPNRKVGRLVISLAGMSKKSNKLVRMTRGSPLSSKYLMLAFTDRKRSRLSRSRVLPSCLENACLSVASGISQSAAGSSSSPLSCAI
jgi:hypothetical protein